MHFTVDDEWHHQHWEEALPEQARMLAKEGGGMSGRGLTDWDRTGYTNDNPLAYDYILIAIPHDAYHEHAVITEALWKATEESGMANRLRRKHGQPERTLKEIEEARKASEEWFLEQIRGDATPL